MFSIVQPTVMFRQLPGQFIHNLIYAGVDILSSARTLERIVPLNMRDNLDFKLVVRFLHENINPLNPVKEAIQPIAFLFGILFHRPGNFQMLSGHVYLHRSSLWNIE